MDGVVVVERVRQYGRAVPELPLRTDAGKGPQAMMGMMGKGAGDGFPPPREKRM